MSAFDNIASTAAREEAHVRDVATAATARVEVVVGRRHGVVAALVLLVVGGAAYWEGRADGSARYDAEHARFEGFVADERVKATEEKNRQAVAKASVEADADKRVRDAQAETATVRGTIDAYVAELAHRPADARCTLSDADLRGLRGLGSPAARPRRRPARAPGGAE